MTSKTHNFLNFYPLHKYTILYCIQIPKRESKLISKPQKRDVKLDGRKK